MPIRNIWFLKKTQWISARAKWNYLFFCWCIHWENLTSFTICKDTGITPWVLPENLSALLTWSSETRIFFRSPFLVWLRTAELCADKSSDFRLHHTPYLYVYIFIAQLCLDSQILPLVCHSEAKKYLDPWMTWGCDLSDLTAFILNILFSLLLGILFKLHWKYSFLFSQLSIPLSSPNVGLFFCDQDL